MEFFESLSVGDREALAALARAAREEPSRAPEYYDQRMREEERLSPSVSLEKLLATHQEGRGRVTESTIVKALGRLRGDGWVNQTEYGAKSSWYFTVKGQGWFLLLEKVAPEMVHHWALNRLDHEALLAAGRRDMTALHTMLPLMGAGSLSRLEVTVAILTVTLESEKKRRSDA